MMNRIVLPALALFAIACSGSYSSPQESSTSSSAADSKGGSESLAKPDGSKPPVDTKPIAVADPPTTVKPAPSTEPPTAQCVPHGSVTVENMGFIVGSKNGGICTASGGDKDCSDAWGSGGQLFATCAGEYHVVARAETSNGCELGDTVVITHVLKDGETIDFGAFPGPTDSPVFPPLSLGMPNDCVAKCAAEGGTISISVDIQGKSDDGVFVSTTAATLIDVTPCSLARADGVHAGWGTGKF